MNKLIAKLDLKDYCNNRTTLKIHLLEDGQLSYGLASTKTGMGHSMSNLQIGYKNGNRLPDHIQDIEGFLKDHILNCIEDSVKTYLPDSYVTYYELEQENPKTGVPKQIIAEILRDEFRDALFLLGQEDKIKQIESRVENSYKEITEEQYQENFKK